MNIELLRKVQAHILEEPKRLDMNDWMSTNNFGPSAPACGTVGCIAGWAAVLSRLAKANWSWSVVDVRKVLDIDYEQAEKLFYVDCWPPDFHSRLGSTNHGSPEYAQVTSDRIDHYIKTEGAE